MNMPRFTLLLLIVCTLFVSLASPNPWLVLSTSEQSNIPEEIQNAEQQFKEAYAAIREAEEAGAKKDQIFTLVDRSNLALSLIEQAKRDYEQGNSTNTDAIAAQVAYICAQLKDEAHELRNVALTSSRNITLLLFILVPLASLIVTLCVHYGLKWLRRSEVEHVMEMEIKEK